MIEAACVLVCPTLADRIRVILSLVEDEEASADGTRSALDPLKRHRHGVPKHPETQTLLRVGAVGICCKSGTQSVKHAPRDVSGLFVCGKVSLCTPQRMKFHRAV